MVQEVKKALRSRPKSVPISIHLSRFLFKYRSTPHSTTDQTPASLLFKKPPTTRLSLLQPSFAAPMQDKQQDQVSSPSREFSSSDYIWVNNARPGSKPKWSNGTVIDRLGPLTYLVSVTGTNRHVHVEHIRRRTSSAASAVPVQPPVTGRSRRLYPNRLHQRRFNRIKKPQFQAQQEPAQTPLFPLPIRPDSLLRWTQQIRLQPSLQRTQQVQQHCRCNSVFVHLRVNVHQLTNSRANLCTIRENEHHGAHFRGVRTRIFVPPAKMCTDRLTLNLTALSSSVAPEQLHMLR